ncbi:MAG: O-antigen ligase family protein [Planctomycetota bacterium]|jgi:hypothetical protein
MKKKPIKSDGGKSRPLVLFEYILLGICISIIALRSTFAESPTIQPLAAASSFNEAVYSLFLSGVLIFCFVVWLVWRVVEGRFTYRRSGIEIGLGVFLAGSFIAGLVAPDKRLAISSVATLVGPILMALLLVQILDSGAKIKFVLAVVAALGIVNAQWSADQFLRSNQATIEEYEKDPEAQVRIHGIEPNSFQQFMLEHRIYSEGVAGYFLTRNSAGAFLLLASFAGIALLVDQFRNRGGERRPTHVFACGVAVGVLLLNLAVTKSKGAFIGLFFAGAVLIICLRFGDWVKGHRGSVFAACLPAAVIAFVVVGWYGVSHGRLPGGSSMLVRWQYWHASARMYAEHWLTGVGPGAFGDYYMRYKPAAALESVSDPHNFVLSFLTQYGPLGLLGFSLMILGAFWRGLGGESGERAESADTFVKPAVLLALGASIVMLVVRPIMLPLSPEATPEEKQAGIVLLYVMPALIFLIGLLIMGFGQRGSRQGGAHSLTGAFLIAGLTGFLIHNLIDFAIFEPGVLMTFWALTACLVASSCNRNLTRSSKKVRLSPVFRVLSVGAGVAAMALYLQFALMPVVRSTALIKKANAALSVDRFDLVHGILDSASSADALSPVAATLDARLHIQTFQLGQKQNPELLLVAEESLLLAISRNSVEYKNYERLTDAYVMLSESDLPSKGESWLKKALESASAAVERYPGCARLRVALARIAEQEGNIELAIEQYEKTIEIEDAYQRQFRMIYPEREDVVSRVGEDKYFFAKDRLKALRGE